jgi:endonuclease YncB( thermonuclease family)
LPLLLPYLPIKIKGNVYVVDGDTFHMNGQKIRIWGIDAVELHQTCLKSGMSYECGKSARLYLQSVIGKNVPVCTSKPKSTKETRTVASCQDLGREMVKKILVFREMVKSFGLGS